MRNALFFCVLLLAACGSSSTEPITWNTLVPYYTHTPESINVPDILLADTPLPTATSFPYVIQEGDTISGLAERFNISQDDLSAANPEIDPQNMPIGSTIFIPNSSSASAEASTPTPVPVPITQAVCHPSLDNGLWCFALVHNNTSGLLEDISLQITLIDENGALIASQPAFLPLDGLPPNASLPAYIFFPNVPANANPQVQLLTAIQLDDAQTRYLPVTLNNALAQIDDNGFTAHLSGEIRLPAESKAATQVWVAAVAYDKQGRVVGIRRWEGGAIQPGTNLLFNFSVASTGSRIDSVDFIAEAK